MARQSEMLFPYWSSNIEWFIIGGPARENEAQRIKEKFPDTKCIGFEPNPEIAYWQRTGTNLFYTDKPFPGQIVECALWDIDYDPLTLSLWNTGSDPCRGSVCAPAQRPDLDPNSKLWKEYKVEGRTLNSLSKQYGPFHNAALWLDIEFAELKALQGAYEILKTVQLINLEAYVHLNLSPIVRFLRGYGLYLMDVWGCGPDPAKDAQDYIFSRR